MDRRTSFSLIARSVAACGCVLWLGLVLAQDAGPPSLTPTADVAAPAAAPAKLAPRGIPRDPIQVLFALGMFMYPLGLCSVIVVWFSIERLVVLRRGRVIPGPFVRRFFEHLEDGKVDARGAIKLCEENGSPIAMVFASGLKKWGKPSVEVEQAIIDGGERQVSHLRKGLRVLNGSATVAPLLGLLGTVVGMIDAFNTIATVNAMGKSEELSGGIGLALLTTAVGLLIAIPALIMYMYLAGRVDTLVIEMDRLGDDLVDLISAEALADQARSGRTPLAAKPAEPRKAV
ncbi:MAG TPA: MotA/TolQ/ExbB proton channel family protein [Planctomycetaceae bacterium]|nr:MotA/TolQ/ExbB proton channel family protein [Planctomycetaceae bacterium]